VPLCTDRDQLILSLFLGVLCGFDRGNEERNLYNIDARSNLETIHLQMFDDIDERYWALIFVKSHVCPQLSVKQAAEQRHSSNCSIAARNVLRG
jgi:hypothetical protein